jgi:hypothetical protein
MGDLNPPSAGEVTVEVKLLLQLKGLVARVRLTTALPFCNLQKDSTEIKFYNLVKFLVIPY